MYNNFLSDFWSNTLNSRSDDSFDKATIFGQDLVVSRELKWFQLTGLCSLNFLCLFNFWSLCFLLVFTSRSLLSRYFL